MEQTSEVIGETADTAVVVSRTLPHPVKKVWDVLMTDEGSEALLGPGAHFGQKGYTWQSHDGRQGVIRTFHPLEEIRFSWRMKDAATPSMVAVNLTVADEESTEVEIKHNRLESGANHNWLTDRWSAALDRIESECM
ncbi:MAG: SRPBCC family protein [Brooklawnia sp.]|jgi:uncharacterized protein YndB with AHSA1/START domain